MKRFLLFIAVLLIVGCSMFKSKSATLVDVTDDVDAETPAIPVCDRTQRNLGVPWHNRQYRCVSRPYGTLVARYYRPEKNGNKKEPQGAPRAGLIIRDTVPRTHNSPPDRYEPVQKGIQQIPRSTQPPRQRLLDDKEGQHHDRDNRIDAQLANASFVISEKTAANEADARRQAAVVIRYRIPFAYKQEVLGPYGTRQVRNLVANALDAKQIKLQGATFRNERKTELHKDKLAVGRALSVRKALRYEGIDRKKITILYRDSETTGRYVDVEVYI